MGEQTLRGKLSGVRCNGASNHSDVEREINDFYATPPIATKKLIEHLKEKYPNSYIFFMSPIPRKETWVNSQGYKMKDVRDAFLNVANKYMKF